MHKWLKISGAFLIAGLALMVGTPAAAQTERPNSLVKVGHYTASSNFLNLSQYYQTTRTTTVKAAYVPTHKFGGRVMRSLTLPKGTVVAGYLTTHKVGSRLQPQLLIYTSRLSHHRLATAQPAGYTIDPTSDTDNTPTVITTARKLRAFKRVHCPRYMPAYSHGDLYAGGAAAAISPVEPTSTSVRVTPDGYVELLTYDHTVRGGLGFYQAPTSQGKITKTVFHDPYRQLYTQHALPGLRTTAVNATGTARYRLTIKNRHQPQHIIGDPLRGIAGTFDSLYLIGGVPYYTFIGYDGASN
ncbi:hypothetical protein [Levilactobacillus namurensis]|uniref:MucBP domain-containing protein n=1 Tax=Levilactobacillus namurensis TaxID=380393 RepID=A0AAW8W2F2_9LACO|nr:hypothetical protein [Levilactobacillus namurensis]MDT7013392.1 hypothetical protein [Levilactobacillus namurensis]